MNIVKSTEKYYRDFLFLFLSVLVTIVNSMNPEYIIGAQLFFVIALTCDCVSKITEFKTRDNDTSKIKFKYCIVLIIETILNLVLNQYSDIGKLNNIEVITCIMFIAVAYLVITKFQKYKYNHKAESSHISLILNYVSIMITFTMLNCILIENSYEGSNFIRNIISFNILHSILLIIFVSTNKYIKLASKSLNIFYKLTIYLEYLIVTTLQFILGYNHKFHTSLIMHSRAFNKTEIMSLTTLVVLSPLILYMILLNIRKSIHYLSKVDEIKETSKQKSLV